MTVRSLALVLITLVVLNFGLTSLASMPSFFVPPNTELMIIKRLYTAWREAIFLARFASISYMGTCEPVFNRFFEEAGDPFVKNVFRTISNIPLDQIINQQTAVEILMSGTVTNLSPKFNTLKVSLGVPAWITDEDYQDYCNREEGFGAFLYGSTRADATLIICPGVLTFPTLEEIAMPPSWALDAQGMPKAGYTCDGLLGRDTQYMVSAGAIVLHELVHWAPLLRTVPDWDFFVGHSDAARIVDYDGRENGGPVDGDGPYNTASLREWVSHEPKLVDEYLTINNADSYMWYALDLYWSWRCQRRFGPAVADADNYLRIPYGATTGGFPLPGNFQAVVPSIDHPGPGTSDNDGSTSF